MYNIADKYPRTFGPRSSAFKGGEESRGWFSDERAHPRIPAAETITKAPAYCKAIWMRVKGGDSTRDVGRGKSGLDSVLSREEWIDNLRSSGCLRKYRIWERRTISVATKYAERIITDGSSPPHIALGLRILSRKVYPRKENKSPQNQIMMKSSASASPLSKSVWERCPGVTIWFDNFRLVEAPWRQSSLLSWWSQKCRWVKSIYLPSSLPSTLS